MDLALARTPPSGEEATFETSSGALSWCPPPRRREKGSLPVPVAALARCRALIVSQAHDAAQVRRRAPHV